MRPFGHSVTASWALLTEKEFSGIIGCVLCSGWTNPAGTETPAGEQMQGGGKAMDYFVGCPRVLIPFPSFPNRCHPADWC